MNLRARRITLEVAVIYVVALAINYVWEMLQMPLFEGMPFSDIDSYLFCLRASIGDANITLGLFFVGLLLFRSWTWPMGFTWVKALYLVLAGAGTAIAIELHAIATDRWSYSRLMPVLPCAEVGLVPTVQMIILPYTNIRFALWILRKRTPRS